MRLPSKRTIIGTLATFLILTSAAFAYYQFFAPGHGNTSPTKIGQVETGAELGLSGTIGTISGPGQAAEVTIQVTNPSAGPQRITKMTATPVVEEPYAKEGCQVAWFTVTGGELLSGLSTPDVIPVGTSTLPQHMTLHFHEEETVNQDACAGAQIHIALTSTP
jgi:hypothetical protein